LNPKIFVLIQFSVMSLFLNSVIPGIGLVTTPVVWVYDRRVALAVIFTSYFMPSMFRVIMFLTNILTPVEIIGVFLVNILITIFMVWRASISLRRILESRGLVERKE